MTASSITNLSPALIVTLAKMLSKSVVDVARDQLEDGTMYDVEGVVHVRGTMSIAEATMTKQVNRLNPYVLMQVALSKLPSVKLEEFLKEALAMQERMKDDEDAPEIVEIKERVTQAMARLTAGVLQRRRGAVSFDGEITAAGEKTTEREE